MTNTSPLPVWHACSETFTHFCSKLREHVFLLVVCVAEEIVFLGLLIPMSGATSLGPWLPEKKAFVVPHKPQSAYLMTGSWNVGPQIAGAAALASARVNADKNLLPGYRMETIWEDSGCSPQKGLTAMGKLVGGKNKINAIIGPACSMACEVTAYSAAGEKKNLAPSASCYGRARTAFLCWKSAGQGIALLSYGWF